MLREFILIVKPGQAEVYYPQGTDWFAGRVDIFYLADSYAALLGWDRWGAILQD